MKYKRAGSVKFPFVQEVNYRNKILELVKFIQKEIKIKLISQLPALYSQNTIIRKDDFIDDIENIINSIKSSAEYKTLTTIRDLSEVANTLSKFTLSQIAKSLSGKIEVTAQPVGVDIFTSLGNSDLQLIIKSWTYTNTRLIKSIPENLLNDVELIVQTGFRAGTSIREISKQIKDKFGVSENRANLIARDQIAKLNSNITKNEYHNLGLNDYVWNTSGDERVRASHLPLNNKICSWQNPTIYKENAEDKKWKLRSNIKSKTPPVEKDVGIDFQCRCTAIALIPIK